MCQVLINLLNNAIKFTPQGGRVELSVRPEISEKKNSGDALCFSVLDTGIGIASEDLPKLFQPFIQLDSNLNRKYEGTGLGLLLVKQIAELHGGRVTIDSQVGQGSCFSVIIPQTLWSSSLPSSASPPLTTNHRQPFHPLHAQPLLLLVEDNEVNINTFSSYFTAKGYRVILAQNGRDAIDLAQRDRPDLILMDIQMPDMDGIEAIQYIRGQSQQPEIPIIALTAQATSKDRSQCLAVGANDYLSKPVKLRELHQTIQRCLELN
jgi:CheY-like chemotaxis protein